MKDTEKKKTPAKTAKKAVAKKAKAPVVVEKKEEVKACCCCKKSPIDAYLDVLASYAKFSGRLSRRNYWWFVLFNGLFAMLCLMLDAVLMTRGILFLTYGLLTIIPSYAAISRRLHDINRSMWWGMLPLLVIPLILQVSGYYKDALFGLWGYMGTLFLVLTYIALILCFVLCFFLLRKGCEGANKYGE